MTPRAIMSRWAKKPLDFEPGTKWQYSNTNYVIAGLIVERVGGMPLLEFLGSGCSRRWHDSVSDTDQAPLGPGDPMRYMRFASARRAGAEGREGAGCSPRANWR